MDEALTKLTEAMEGLKKEEPPVEVDKTALDALIEEVSGKNQDDYTAESWNAFHTALLKAKEVSADKNATKDQVEEALKALQEAADGLVTSEESVDKSALEAAIKEAEGKNRDHYTDESWAEFEEALAEAKRVLDMDVDQSRVDSAAAALRAAMEGLEELPKADKTGLNQIIAEAEGKKASDYTEESWDAFNRALVNAKAAAAETYASQVKVDEAAQALKQAMEALKPVENGGGSDNPDNPSGGEGGDNNDQNNPSGGEEGGNDDGNGGDTNQPSDDNQPSGSGSTSDAQNNTLEDVKTGDHAQAGIAVMVLTASALAVAGCGTAIYRRKREDAENRDE